MTQILEEQAKSGRKVRSSWEMKNPQAYIITRHTAILIRLHQQGNEKNLSPRGIFISNEAGRAGQPKP